MHDAVGQAGPGAVLVHGDEPEHRAIGPGQAVKGGSGRRLGELGSIEVQIAPPQRQPPVPISRLQPPDGLHHPQLVIDLGMPGGNTYGALECRYVRS